MASTLLTPSFLSTFGLGLQVPEFGPVVPLFNPLLNVQPQGALGPNYDLFLPVASTMQQEAEQMRAERRPSPLPRGSLARLFGVKNTISGLPKDVGESPEDGRLRWVVQETCRYEGDVSALTFRQLKKKKYVGRSVEVRHRDMAVYVRVSYGALDLQIDHAATFSREESGDFQSLSFRIGAEFQPQKLGLDLRGHYAADAARSVFIDELPYTSEISSFQIWNRAGVHADGSDKLNVRFVRRKQDALFPKSFVELVRRLAKEIERRLASSGNGKAGDASLALSEWLAAIDESK